MSKTAENIIVFILALAIIVALLFLLAMTILKTGFLLPLSGRNTRILQSSFSERRKPPMRI